MKFAFKSVYPPMLGFLLLTLMAGAEQPSRWSRFEDPGDFGRLPMHSVSFDGGMFVADEFLDTFLSSDGLTWQKATCRAGYPDCLLVRIDLNWVWLGDEYIGVGKAGRHNVYSLTQEGDLRIVGECIWCGLKSIAFDGTNLIAVGDSGIVRSVDGRVWESVVFYPTRVCWWGSENIHLTSVTWTGEMWVAVGTVWPCGSIIFTSSDSENWSERDFEEKLFYAVGFDGDTIVAVGDSAMVSADGLSWHEVTPPPVELRHLSWTGNEWRAIADGREVYASPDATAWTQIAAANGCLSDIASGNGTTVAVGRETVFREDENGDWINQSFMLPEARSLIWDGQLFLAYGPRSVHSSPDGQNWRRIQCNLGYSVTGRDVVTNGQIYVASGSTWAGHQNYGHVSTSSDGVTWQYLDFSEATTENPMRIRAITWDGSNFVVIGGDFIARSPDGENWSFASSDVPIWQLEWNGHQYVGLSEDGLWISDDATTWNGPFKIWDESVEDLRDHGPRLAVNEEQTMVIRPDGRLTVSEDGTQWMPCTLEEDAVIGDVVWTGKDWVAVSLDERVYVSGDGVTWHREPVPWQPKPYNPEPGMEVANRFRLAVGGNRVVAVSNGLTLVRDCNPPAPRRGGRRSP